MPKWAIGVQRIACGRGPAPGLPASWRRDGVVLWSSRNRNASFLEGELVTDDGDRRLSEDAQDLDDHLRGLASDLGPSDVRKKPTHYRRNLLWLAPLLAAIAILLVVIPKPDLLTRQSEPLDASGTESTVADQGAASSVSISDTTEPTSDTAGPISGTWAMYWTNSEGSETQAFAITFTGSDTGTLEIYEDDTEVDATFKVDGDRVVFEFTRTFKVPIGDWPEKSTFKGTLTGRNDMTGKWARQGWECWSAPDAGCKTTEWSRHDSRLIRISE